ncbi:MAG: peptidylprolyl isomerase [Synergistaceae bacterium]|jgi:peptidyl-prolyl cis-trans isomerase A (cyclophilin A)|nr:peptidylprolyl isomerase [Synergistaceae bacterium]
MERILIVTELGEIEAALFTERSPLTCSHFLSYVDGRYYDAASFYRSVRRENQPLNSVKISIIEGGFSNEYYDRVLMENFVNGCDVKSCPVGPKPRIKIETTRETGMSHDDGTLSLGRWDEISVDDSFFICVGAQPDLDFGGSRNPDGLGFSAFGKVTRGMAVVRTIHALPAKGQRITDGVTIKSISRISSPAPLPDAVRSIPVR